MEIAYGILGLFVVVGSYFAYQQLTGHQGKHKNSAPLRDDQKANLLYHESETYYTDKKYKDALDLIDQAIDLHPHDVRYYERRALIYLALNQFDFAEQDCTYIAVNFSPTAQSYFVLGSIALVQDKLDDALSYFQKTLDLQSAYTLAHLRRQEIYLKQGNLQAAEVEVALLTHKFAPEHIDYFKIGETYLLYKQYQLAINYFDVALERIKVNRQRLRIIIKRAFALQQMGDLETAVAEYEKAITMVEPRMQSDSVFHALKQAYIQLNNIPQAVETLRKCITFNPDIALAHNDYAWWLTHLGNYETALTHADKAVSLDEQNSFYLSTRGQAKWLLGDYQGALDDYTLALANAEMKEIHHLERAIALLRLNQLDEAISEWAVVQTGEETTGDAKALQEKYHFAPPFYEAMQALEKLANQAGDE